MIANPNDGNSPRVEVATPTIDVSAGGLITATTEQEKGYVSGGTKSATQQLTTQGAATITPTTTNQTAVASGRYTTGEVQVAGDSNLVPENIAEGVSIFGIQGTHSGGGGDMATVSISSPIAATFLVNIEGTYVELSPGGSATVPKNSLIVVKMPSLVFPGIYTPDEAAIIQTSISSGAVYYAIVQVLNNLSISGII